MSLLLHTHNSEGAFPAAVGSGGDLGSPRLASHRTDIPFGWHATSQQRVPYKSHLAWPIVSIFVLFCIKEEQEEKEKWKEEKDQRGLSHLRFSMSWTLNILWPWDKTNVLFIYFIVLHKDKNIFCLSLFSTMSEKERDYLSNSSPSFFGGVLLCIPAGDGWSQLWLNALPLAQQSTGPCPPPLLSCLLDLPASPRPAGMCVLQLASQSHFEVGILQLSSGNLPVATTGAGESPSIQGCQLFCLPCYRPSEEWFSIPGFSTVLCPWHCSPLSSAYMLHNQWHRMGRGIVSTVRETFNNAKK